MRGLTCRMTKRLNVGAFIRIVDNSGAQQVQLLSVKHYGGVKNRYARAGIGDLCTCAVTIGTPELRHTLVPVVIVQQRGYFKRADGSTVRFQDNAGVLLKEAESDEPKGSIIKEPVAKEAIERFGKIGKIAKVVV